jgi:hypothetical protein
VEAGCHGCRGNPRRRLRPFLASPRGVARSADTARPDAVTGFCAAKEILRQRGNWRRLASDFSWKPRIWDHSKRGFRVPLHGMTYRSVLRIAGFRGLSMDAGFKRLLFGGVALCAFRGRYFCRRAHFVGIAMAGGARCVSQHHVSARENVGPLFPVASQALHLGDFFRMRKILDAGVTVLASEDSMNTGRVLLGMDRNIPAVFGFHPGLAVACQASLVLLQGFCFGCFLGAGMATERQE